MDWMFVLYGAMFFFGLILCIAKLFYMFHKKTKGYTNLCIQYITGTSVFVLLIGTLGIIAARLSNVSGEVGVDIFLVALIWYLITTVTFCFIAIGLEIFASLLRKGNVNILLRVCLGLIVLSPICTTAIVVGLSAKEGQLIGTHVLSIMIFVAVILSSIFVVIILRKAKFLATAISPIFEQQSNDRNDVEVNSPKGSVAIHPGPSANEDIETNNNKIVAMQSLKSNLKKTEKSMKEFAHRSVCFLIGRETEIWHRQKEIRRIERERDKAVLFLVLLLCYSICFLPFGFLLLYHGTFSIQNLACRIAYVSAAFFAIIEPTVYILYINVQTHNA